MSPSDKIIDYSYKIFVRLWHAPFFNSCAHVHMKQKMRLCQRTIGHEKQPKVYVNKRHIFGAKWLRLIAAHAGSGICQEIHPRMCEPSIAFYICWLVTQWMQRNRWSDQFVKRYEALSQSSLHLGKVMLNSKDILLHKRIKLWLYTNSLLSCGQQLTYEYWTRPCDTALTLVSQ
jgi:hypothetical protein